MNPRNQKLQDSQLAEIGGGSSCIVNSAGTSSSDADGDGAVAQSDAPAVQSSCSVAEFAAQKTECETAMPNVGEHRAWADCPQDFDTAVNFCDDPTPQEALLVSTAQRHQGSSDSGGEEENKENVTNSVKNGRKKGKLMCFELNICMIRLITGIAVLFSCENAEKLTRLLYSLLLVEYHSQLLC